MKTKYNYSYISKKISEKHWLHSNSLTNHDTKKFTPWKCNITIKTILNYYFIIPRRLSSLSISVSQTKRIYSASVSSATAPTNPISSSGSVSCDPWNENKISWKI